jgi:hypothetical protein
MKKYPQPDIFKYVAGFMFIPALFLGWIAIIGLIVVCAIILIAESFNKK